MQKAPSTSTWGSAHRLYWGSSPGHWSRLGGGQSLLTALTKGSLPLRTHSSFCPGCGGHRTYNTAWLTPDLTAYFPDWPPSSQTEAPLCQSHSPAGDPAMIGPAAKNRWHHGPPEKGGPGTHPGTWPEGPASPGDPERQQSGWQTGDLAESRKRISAYFAAHFPS